MEIEFYSNFYVCMSTHIGTRVYFKFCAEEWPLLMLRGPYVVRIWILVSCMQGKVIRFYIILRILFLSIFLFWRAKTMGHICQSSGLILGSAWGSLLMVVGKPYVIMSIETWWCVQGKPFIYYYLYEQALISPPLGPIFLKNVTRWDMIKDIWM